MKIIRWPLDPLNRLVICGMEHCTALSQVVLQSWYLQEHPRDMSTHCPHATWPLAKCRVYSQVSGFVHAYLPHIGIVLQGQTYFVTH